MTVSQTCAPPLRLRTLRNQFPGTAANVPIARHWARGMVTVLAGAALADAAEMAVGELLANAVQHSLSGSPGGTFSVIVTGGLDGVVLHVHDLGLARRVVPRPRRAQGPAGATAESGRGLEIVQLVSADWGFCRADVCDPSVAAGSRRAGNGRCTWVRLLSGEREG